MRTTLTTTDKRTLLENAAQGLVEHHGLLKPRGGGEIDASLLREDVQVIAKFLGAPSRTVGDAEVEQAFQVFVGLNRGSEQRAIDSLRALGEPLPDFQWSTKPLTWWGHCGGDFESRPITFAGARYDDSAFLRAQIAALVALAGAREPFSIPGLERLTIVTSDHVAAEGTTGYAGAPGSGRVQRVDFDFESTTGEKRNASIWTEQRDGKVANGGWIGAVPPELEWFGLTDSLTLDCAAMTFRALE